MSPLLYVLCTINCILCFLFFFSFLLFLITLGHLCREIKDVDFPDVPPLSVGFSVGAARRTTILLNTDVAAQDWWGSIGTVEPNFLKTWDIYEKNYGIIIMIPAKYIFVLDQELLFRPTCSVLPWTSTSAHIVPWLCSQSWTWHLL